MTRRTSAFFPLRILRISAARKNFHIQRRIALDTEAGKEITEDANRNADLAIFVLGRDH